MMKSMIEIKEKRLIFVLIDEIDRCFCDPLRIMVVQITAPRAFGIITNSFGIIETETLYTLAFHRMVVFKDRGYFWVARIDIIISWTPCSSPVFSTFIGFHTVAIIPALIPFADKSGGITWLTSSHSRCYADR